MNVFPVREGSKAPAIKDWRARAAAIDSWNGLATGRWGAPTGERNGWWVLDIDPRHGGLESLALLQERYGRLPETMEVRTPSGGWHYYFKWEAVCSELTNTAGKLGPGLDIRAEGGMVLVPPTPGYEIMSTSEAAAAPAWLLALLLPSASSSSPGKSDEQPVRNPLGHASRAIASAIEEIKAAPDGTRDACMNRNAYGLGRVIGICGLNRDSVIELLVTTAVEAGYNAHKALDCVTRAVDAGMKNPREAAASSSPAAVQGAPAAMPPGAPVDQLRPCPPKPGAAPADLTSAAGRAWSEKQAAYQDWMGTLRLALDARLVLVQYDQSRVLYERIGLRRVSILGTGHVQAGAITRIGESVGLLVPPGTASAMVEAYLVQAHAVTVIPSLWDRGDGLYLWEAPKVEAGPTPTWDAILERISDPVAFLAHVWSAFEPRFVGRQVLWLQGEGNDGKSILFSAIFEGSGVPMAAVNDDDLQRASQFLFSTVWDKPAVLIGDSKSVNLMMMGAVHRLTGRDYIGVEYKHGARFNAKFQGVVWVASNQRPEIEHSRSNLSRLSFLTIRPGEWVDGLAGKLRAELPGLLARAREAYVVACPRHFDIRLNEHSEALLEESTSADSEKHAAMLKRAGLRVEGNEFVSRKDILVRLDGKLDALSGRAASFYRWLGNQPGVTPFKDASGQRGFKGLAS